jgi:hypothetical protein
MVYKIINRQYYKTIKHEYILVQEQKKYLLDSMNNLSYMNTMNLYQDTDLLFMTILNELKTIKHSFDKYPSIFYKINNKTNIDCTYNDIQKTLIKYSNHITPPNILDILKLFNYKLNSNGNQISADILDFIIKFICPISASSSIYHTKNIPYNIPANTKKKNIMSSGILDTLLDIANKNNENDIKTIIFNTSYNNTNAKDFISPDTIVVKTINNLLIENDSTIDYNDCVHLLNNTNIQIVKNIKSHTLIEDKLGVSIYLKDDNQYIIIQALIIDDLLNIAHDMKFIQSKIKTIKGVIAYDLLTVPRYFSDNYVKTFSLRDIVIINKLELVEDIKKKYHDFKLLQMKTLIDLVNEFLLSSKYRKVDILTLLLMSNEDDQKLGYILFDIFKSKDKKNVANEIYSSLHYSIRELLDLTKSNTDKEDNKFLRLSDNDIPYEKRISMMKTSGEVKMKAYEKLKLLKSPAHNDGKAGSWLDGLLKLPFGIYNENEIISFKNKFIQKLDCNFIYSESDIDKYLENNPEHLNEWQQYNTDKCNYLQEIRTTLDKTVYGHKDAKIQLERLFAQWINGESKGAVIGLQGPPGTGKTSLVKHGLSKCLKDKDGKPRPFAFLPIGGSVNSSTLVGHNFTYVGSTWGRIADILMVSKCMNPIIFIDEVDKVSQTEYGREIISILTHLTDTTQNDEFEDKYFAGIPLDLSKALIVFSFNDPSLIDPILRDRITIIETHPLSLNDKLIIINDYMLPEICKDIGFNRNEIIIHNDTIKYIIETFTMEAGVRKMKEKMIELVRDINLNRFYDKNIKLPFTIDIDYVTRLFENKPKIRVKKIAPEPMVGLVNGLYATSSGVGGLTVIQLTKFPSDKMLDIQLTGKPGDTMKESVQYALKVAWSLLPVKTQQKIIKDSHNKKGYGIHVHCPDAATPKDGPSAGAAFTIAIYSLLTDTKINNKICMTGEIDLLGNITAIGGVESKLFGGKKSGCTMALIPQENWEDYENLVRANNVPENFIVKPVSHIRDVIKLILI